AEEFIDDLVQVQELDRMLELPAGSRQGTPVARDGPGGAGGIGVRAGAVSGAHASATSSLMNPTPFLLIVISTPSATCRRTRSSVTWVTLPWMPPIVTIWSPRFTRANIS